MFSVVGNFRSRKEPAGTPAVREPWPRLCTVLGDFCARRSGRDASGTWVGWAFGGVVGLFALAALVEFNFKIVDFSGWSVGCFRLWGAFTVERSRQRRRRYESVCAEQ